MYDISRIQKEFIDLCGGAGVSVSAPITLNGRLTRTLGRVIQENFNGVWKSTSVEFSKKFIETSTDENIKDVIAHEAAHYIVTARTGEYHGHDSFFKSVCAEIGTTNDGTTTKVERQQGAAALYKYSVYCETCEETVAEYSRMCKTLKNISLCSCRKCGDSKLKIIQNW